MRRAWIVVAIIVVALVAAGALRWRWPTRRFEPQAKLSVTNALGGDAEGFARVLTPRPFRFPEDHGPHPEFRNEWWYWTGNLQAIDGRRFGYQLTFFRTRLTAHPTPRQSAWASDTVYMAHLTVTDVSGRRFHAFDRFSRDALALAGAQANPFRVWLGSWSAQSQGAEWAPLHLKASTADASLDLTLDSGKPVVLQGDRGLSQKGPEPGNASYYYSLTRMPTRGTLMLEGKVVAVEGTSWMDREWGTSQLSTGQEGWDWFSLQLSDGSELMYYQLRDQGARVDPLSHGTLIHPDGHSTPISAPEISLSVSGEWKSPHSGIRYPSEWRLKVPREGLELSVVPYLADQELDLAVRYWEGASRVSGMHAGQPVEGSGYVELTGYAHE